MTQPDIKKLVEEMKTGFIERAPAQFSNGASALDGIKSPTKMGPVTPTAGVEKPSQANSRS